MSKEPKPKSGITENQLSYLDELRVSKKEAAQILEKETIEGMTQLTKAQAFKVISETIDRTVLKFHPGAKIKVNITITSSDEGLPVSFRGEARVEHYTYQMTTEGMYINIVFHIPSLIRTITRGIGFFRKHAEVLEENDAGKESAQHELEKYNRLKEWHQVLVKNIARIWWAALHAEQLPHRALSVVHLSPGLKKKLIGHMMGELERNPPRDHHLTDEVIVETLKTVAGHVLFD